MSLFDLRPQAVRRSLDAQIAHMRLSRLDLKFSAGIWYFSPFVSRFHDRYGPAVDLERRLETAAGLKSYGLSALEAHYPNEINEENLGVWKKFSQQTGIRVLTVIPLLFWDQQFEHGSLSSPIVEARSAAIERTKKSLAMNKELGCDFCVVWAGIDGFENPFGQDFLAMRDRFVDGLAEAMDAVPGVRVAFEPKPYEPRGRILFSTTPEGVLLGRLVEAKLKNPINTQLLAQGHTLVGLNPEVGHLLMGFEDLAYGLSWPMSEGRLAHTHWNSQPLGNYDQDLNVGVVSPEQMEAGLYAMKMHDYRGFFGIDINPERMPVDTAVKISIDALRAACDRIEAMDHASILTATARPDKHAGWLESHLVRMRAHASSQLTPLKPIA